MPAAKQSNKRAVAQGPAEKAPKKARQDPMLVAVIDAISQAEDLSESCRAMLKAAAPSCLTTPKEERHEVQTRAVEWIGTAVRSVLGKLQEAASNVEANLTECTEKRGALEAKAAEAAATSEARKEETKAKGAELAEASKAIHVDQAGVTAAVETQAHGDAAFEKAKKDKETLEAALLESAKPLKAGTCGADEASAHIKRLLPLASSFGLDDSLQVALPTSGVKAYADRGTFDLMVMDGLECGLQAKAAELAELIAEGAPAAAERALAVETAKAKLDASRERQRAAAEEVRSAQAKQQEAEAALASAKGAVASLEPERKAIEDLLEERRFVLQNFEGYNMDSFRMLSEKETEAALAAKKKASAAPITDAATAGA